MTVDTATQPDELAGLGRAELEALYLRSRRSEHDLRGQLFHCKAILEIVRTVCRRRQITLGVPDFL